MRMSSCFQNILKDVERTKISEVTSQFLHKLTKLTFIVDLHEHFPVRFSFWFIEHINILMLSRM